MVTDNGHEAMTRRPAEEIMVVEHSWVGSSRRKIWKRFRKTA